MSEPRENVIGWVNGDDRISCTFSQKKYINKVRKLAKLYPENVRILAENSDGSITCYLSLKSLKLSIIKPKEREFYNFGRNKA